ncbi:hypothetical protein PROFUN_11235 [Planoprotostelium fungivorum]|uniref:Major facilitator superfamily (MFS) profile domain-containing protein n=1 Tax=Planoprotostelium fungivorum TaxID=1890364 RepID=A0A2P6NA54_9EUKA|nr:hypothetical protein PROFUN_11235 [Planoprotostelium fungivorum]
MTSIRHAVSGKIQTSLTDPLPETFTLTNSGVTILILHKPAGTGARSAMSSKYGAVFASGMALFSDGYAIVGTCIMLIKRQYGPDVLNKSMASALGAVAFIGTIIGQLTFGWISDKMGRKFGMLSATAIIIAFSVLCALPYGLSAQHLLIALIVFRFFLGVGIGAEYPAGSVAASENSEGEGINKKKQHLLFALATNNMIDLGFVVASLMPLILYVIFGDSKIEYVWRLSFGFGALPPLILLFFRRKMKEPERFQKDSMQKAPIPYLLIFKRYWMPLCGISITWFIYDFISYPFALYTSTIIDGLVADQSLTQNLGWSTFIMCFYLPGATIGAFTVDYLGPRKQMIIGLLLQALFGFLMAFHYELLKGHVAGFAIIYGLFLTFGEFGTGDNIGLLASKTGPSAVRGQFYAVCAAVGKVGAFVGTFVFPYIQSAVGGENSTLGQTVPFHIGSALAIISAIVLFFLTKELPADCMAVEDANFKKYLEENGYDVRQMGAQDSELEESLLGGDQEERKRMSHLEVSMNS